MIVWGGALDASSVLTNSCGRYNPVTDTWNETPLSTTNAPSPRTQATAVGACSEMTVWGGLMCDPDFRNLNMGVRYDPTADAWTVIPTAGALAGFDARSQKIPAVWTGGELIVWGIQQSTGGRYTALLALYRKP